MFSFGRRWTDPTGEKREKPSALPEETVDVSADIATAVTANGDVDYSTNPLKGLYVGGGSGVVVYVSRVDDAGKFFAYQCDKGTYIYGLIARVGAVSPHATTATALVGER